MTRLTAEHLRAIIDRQKAASVQTTDRIAIAQAADPTASDKPGKGRRKIPLDPLQEIAEGDHEGRVELALDVDPKAIRTRLGLTQRRFADALHIPVATLQNWEQGRVSLDPAARSLLLIVGRNPAAAFRALNGADHG